ncbi:hypothetical protein HII36_03615 [Nonomuraea sp. NN258]|uniref:hypothetical protein n=1 Tax=Nonomuraea antri TaxID=2730852 RepID=UPI00156A0434|nr:hypothetical protein [Nonomuraea antri]NRQ30925.1 hypothetical protein [Nonomuraea antri]
MTEPANTSTVSGTSSETDRVTTRPASRPHGELAVHRETQHPARGHLPLTVWLAAADTESISTCLTGCCHPVSGPLARHLIVACTRMGETVIHLGAADHQLVSAVLTAGCLPVAVFTDAHRAGVTWTRLARTHPDYDLEVTDLRITDPDDEEIPLTDLAGCAGLVVTELTCDQLRRRGSHHAVKPHDIASAARLVKPGGHLAVVTGLHYQGRLADPLPEIIAQARAAGLVYLQHIIALRQSARGDRVQACLPGRGQVASQDLPQCAGLPASARVHSDVLLFIKPAMPPCSSAPVGPLADANASASEEKTRGTR